MINEQVRLLYEDPESLDAAPNQIRGLVAERLGWDQARTC
jgi:hypothetical protein